MNIEVGALFLLSRVAWKNLAVILNFSCYGVRVNFSLLQEYAGGGEWCHTGVCVDTV